MPAAFAQAYTDLQSAATTIAAADAMLADKRWENATSIYQAAGQQGSQTLAADIRGTSPPNDTLVQQADGVYAHLLGLEPLLASQATAVQAQTLAKQQWQLYSTAVRAMQGTAPTAIVVRPTSTVVPSLKANMPLLVIGGLAVIGAGGWLYWRYVHTRENGGPDGKVDKALIAKGRSCRFEMVDGPAVSVAGGMLHDPSGRWWPKRSVLCGPFKARERAAADDEFKGPAKDYLGKTHNASIGSVDTPPKSLGEWEYLGEVSRVYYTRTGKKRPGRYQHPFNKPTALSVLVKGKGKAKLYRHGRFARLDLPPGAILDSRGLVWP
jgi:hypothetical protein